MGWISTHYARGHTGEGLFFHSYGFSLWVAPFVIGMPSHQVPAPAVACPRGRGLVSGLLLLLRCWGLSFTFVPARALALFVSLFVPLYR